MTKQTINSPQNQQYPPVGAPLVGARFPMGQGQGQGQGPGQPRGIAPTGIAPTETPTGTTPTTPTYNSKNNRRSIRLKNHDYSQAGYYFITMCTQNRSHLFGEIVDDGMVLNIAGKMINKIWLDIPNQYEHAKLHQYVIMPNHFHGIIEITVGVPLVGTRFPMGPGPGQPRGIAPTGIAPTENPTEIAPTTPTVGDIIGGVKSITTNEYIKMVKKNILPPFDKRIWQRNYWEHIIRNDDEYHRIAHYIINNPQKWASDKLNGGDGNVIMDDPEIYGQLPATPNKEIWMV